MSIELKVDWTTPETGEDAGHELAWGKGILYVAGAPVWFSGTRDNPQPIAWSWIDLLEFLSRRWSWITGEQGLPSIQNAKNPLELRDAGIRASDDKILDDDTDEEIFHFEGRHDLARGMPGIRLPSLMVVREGNSACIAAESLDKLLHLPLDQVLSGLSGIAEKILQKVSLATHSERAKDAINAWNNRESIAAIKKLQLVTGLNLTDLKITGLATNLAEWDLSADDPLADSELAAAARFARSGKKETYDSFASDRKKILEQIKCLPSLKVYRIDELSVEMEALLKEDWQEEPFIQGYNLALNLRKKLKLDDDEAADPEQFLGDHNIEVRDTWLSPAIDGIGCWGPRHGPVIFVNAYGRHSQEPHGRRATLAHEICHLLVDRKRTLPLAEVMGGNSPYIPEQRANAFAGEFLLPRYIASMCYRNHRDVKKAINELKGKFGVGTVLVANQLYHSKNLGLTAPEASFLEMLIKTGEEDVDF